MIVVDTSALIAIMRKEPERDAFVQAIRNDGEPIISVASILETTMVASRALQRGARDAVDAFVLNLALRPLPVTLGQIEVAQAAFFEYGKGQGGRAQLNFGNCMVYGLAKWLNVPVLIKGGDFANTDIVAAVAAT
jgi:ribonuclease VapC